MATEYTVESGDCLSSIGDRFGVPWKKIWDAPENQGLREKRGNPNVLYPGDVVYVPDKTPKYHDGANEKRHRYRVPGRVEVKIQILDLAHEPVAGVVYRFVVEGQPKTQRTTGADGIAQEFLPKHCSQVKLRLPWGDFPVAIGELAPARTIRGMQQRLVNLGIDPGPVDGIYGPLTARGIRSFQALESLEANGRPYPAFIRRLREVHDKQVLDGAHNETEEHPVEPHDILPADNVDKSVGDELLDKPKGAHIDQNEFPVPDFVMVDDP